MGAKKGSSYAILVYGRKTKKKSKTPNVFPVRKNRYIERLARKVEESLRGPFKSKQNKSRKK